MKRFIVWLVAILAGVYALVPMPPFTPVDPIPFLDEGMALMIFVKSMAWLGYDVRRWLPFVKARGAKPPPLKRNDGVTIEV